MNGLIAWFTRNSVASNLLMWVIVLSGLVAAFSVKQEVFPEFSLDMITVTVPYPGAAPEEVEEAVCVRIEEEIQGVDGIKRLTSTASENVGVVTAELLLDADPARVLDDIKAGVDGIDTFPDDVEEPVVKELLQRRQVIDVAVYGDAPERTIKEIAERVRDDLATLPGITQVVLSVVRPYEISIEVSETALRRFGIQ
ncbi:MAG: efflux RND transporter permease subunit, partial [Candidatus Eiseniibacteriota bacterium]